jgi:hypothetical protein
LNQTLTPLTPKRKCRRTGFEWSVGVAESFERLSGWLLFLHRVK